MTHFEQEIIDIHVALENWLGQAKEIGTPCSPVSVRFFDGSHRVATR